jgi:hypothetical protein
LSVDPRTVTLAAGEHATIDVAVINEGETEETVRLRVSDLPDAWVTLPSLPVTLKPNQREIIEMDIAPRFEKDVVNDLYRFTLAATDLDGTKVLARTSVTLNVEIERAFSVELEPKTAIAGDSSHLVITNNGDAAERYSLLWSDLSGGLRLGISRADMVIAPKSSEYVHLSLQPQANRHMIGRQRRYPYEIHVHAGNGKQRDVVSGHLAVDPLVPTWAMWIIGAMCITFLIMAAYYWVI